MIAMKNTPADDHMYDFDSGNTINSFSRPPVTAFNKNPLNAPRPIATSLGNRTSLGSRAGLSTSSGRSSAAEGRPMTSVSGAGYNGKVFDPLSLNKNNFIDTEKVEEPTAVAKAKVLERSVMKLLEESAKASSEGISALALEKAKDASKAEKELFKFQETNGLAESINTDLTFSINLHLANSYFQNNMYEDSLNIYQSMLKGKQFPHSAKIRTNMGNVYYQQCKFPMAIKMYRMAIDQVPMTHKSMRGKLKRNIASCFVRLGQFQDAIDNYDDVMQVSADVQTAFNLMVCLFTKGDKARMRRHFTNMMTLPIIGLSEIESDITEDTCNDNNKHDYLKEEVTIRRTYFEDKLLQAARLIAPAICEDDDDWTEGYKWLLDQLRPENESVMSKLELDLAIEFMRKGQYEEAINLLKSFEKKDLSLRAMASINLSFLYFLEGDYTLAERYADIAIKSDRYNAKGLVNKGNCLYMSQDYSQAKEFYLEAVGVEADCLEAMFNLGLVNEKLGSLQEAYGAFDKLHTILPTLHEALYNIGGIFEKSEERSDLEQAVKTYEGLVDRMPQDALLCTKIAQLYERIDDEESACHWQKESHRRDANQLGVISWLGVWHVKREMYEEAVAYFGHAALVQPSEPKWRLMTASCYRRLGDLHKSYEIYLKVHERHPDNLEALQYLEALCRDLGRSSDEFTQRLDRLRRSLGQRAVAMHTSMPTQLGTVDTERSGTSVTEKIRMTYDDDEEETKQDHRSLPTRSARPGKVLTEQIEATPNIRLQTLSSVRPMSPPRTAAGGRNVRKPAEDDDFGDTDVSSLLV